MRNFSHNDIEPGVYCRYDGKLVRVVLVTTDADTGEEIVVCRDTASFFTMKERSFSSFADVDGQLVEKFTYLGKEVETRPDAPEGGKRAYRSQISYEDYARDLCLHYMEDMRKFNLCVTEKRYLDISKEDFLAVREDLSFLQNCLKTVLRPYSDFFEGRFVQELSIRKYADARGINRGSVLYTQKKLFSALAAELEARDKEDGVCRLKVPPKWDLSEG